MLLDVRSDHLQMVRDILQKHVPQCEVWAFGSRAKWTAKEYSDLDLCIVSDKPLSFSVLGAIEEDFSESDLPWKVDVVDWATTSPSFRKIIERDKVLVHRQNCGMSSEFSEPTFEEIKAPMKSAFSMGPFGSRIKAENFVTEGVPVIKGGNLNGDLDSSSFDFLTPEKAAELSTSIARRLDLVITHRGTLGQVGIIPPNSRYPEYIVSQSQLKLSFDQTKVNPYFIYYFLRSSVGQRRLLANTSQVGVPAIAQALTSIRNIRVPLPSLKEQDSIVGTLRLLDDRIALLHETNTTLEGIAQALFKSWFVNFDPVRAKAEGLEPEGISPKIAALFPREFENSKLGEIPKGWKAMPLSDACEINPTRRLTKGKQSPYLEMSALPTQGHRTDTPIPRAFSSGTKFINGDTLLARITPCLENGKTAFVDCLLEDEVGWGSTEYIVLRPKAPLPSYWAYLLSRHEHFRQYAIQAMVGTSGRQRVDVSRLAQYLVAVPDAQLSAAFAELVEPIQRTIAANDAAAKSLAALRDTLLPRLMSGKLRIADESFAA